MRPFLLTRPVRPTNRRAGEPIAFGRSARKLVPEFSSGELDHELHKGLGVRISDNSIGYDNGIPFFRETG